MNVGVEFVTKVIKEFFDQKFGLIADVCLQASVYEFKNYIFIKAGYFNILREFKWEIYPVFSTTLKYLRRDEMSLTIDMLFIEYIKPVKDYFNPVWC